jgi:hypothetical protein
MLTVATAPARRRALRPTNSASTSPLAAESSCAEPGNARAANGCHCPRNPLPKQRIVSKRIVFLKIYGIVRYQFQMENAPPR